MQQNEWQSKLDAITQDFDDKLQVMRDEMAKTAKQNDKKLQDVLEKVKEHSLKTYQHLKELRDHQEDAQKKQIAAQEKQIAVQEETTAELKKQMQEILVMMTRMNGGSNSILNSTPDTSDVEPEEGDTDDNGDDNNNHHAMSTATDDGEVKGDNAANGDDNNNHHEMPTPTATDDTPNNSVLSNSSSTSKKRPASPLQGPVNESMEVDQGTAKKQMTSEAQELASKESTKPLTRARVSSNTGHSFSQDPSSS